MAGPRALIHGTYATFAARDPAGRPRTIHVLRKMLRRRHPAEGWAEVLGPPELTTDLGGAVTRLRKGRYLVEKTGEALVSEDPAAI